MTEPLVRVISGNPTDEELAALTVVLMSLLAANGCGEASEVDEGPVTWRREHDRYRSPVSWQHRIPRAA